MLCGLSRLNAHSAVAVATFFPMAILTHHLVHPSLLTQVCQGDVPCYLPVYPSSSTLVSLATIAAAAIFASSMLPNMVASVFKSNDEKPQVDTEAIGRDLTSFFSGLEFGLGLLISQMANPAKVASFLSFPNRDLWDPSLMLIIIFAVIPSLIENRFRGTSQSPRFAKSFVPSMTDFKGVSTLR